MLTKNTLFRPSKSESKADSTTKIAMELIEAENAERDAKTARLRAARVAREASAEKGQAAATKKKTRKKAPAEPRSET